jgi:hypothetical protein
MTEISKFHQEFAIYALEAFLADLLEARLVVCEMERTLLIFEIDSPETTPERRAEAIARRDAVIVHWGELMTELCDLRPASAFR